MVTNKISRIVFTTFIVLFCQLVAAQTRVVKVLDSNGRALSDVVISVPSDTLPVISQKPAVMDQINKQFVPNVLPLQKGARVDFPNSDNMRHHVYSFSQAKTFEIKLYSGNVSEPVLFNKEGVVVLGCNIHDQMIGYIYVYDKAIVALTNEQGEATLPLSAKEVTLWHPFLSVDPGYREPVTLSESDGLSPETITVKLNAVPEPAPPAKVFGQGKFGN